MDKTPSDLPLFEIISPTISQINFVNRLRESPSQNVLTYEYFYNGAGVAVADFNTDGLPDIYLVSNLEPNHLYLNQGDLTFMEIGKISQTQGKRGFATGVSIVDINADGLPDIYVCKSGRFTQANIRRNELFINEGTNADGIPIFSEQAEKYGLDIAAYSTQATFFDYDLDGDLDMFLINHGIDTYDTREIVQLAQERDSLMGEMLFNNDNNYFTEVTAAAGIIQNKLGFGLGVGVGDFNQDNYPDLYVSNDYSGRDHLYLNQKNGTFQERIKALTNQTSFYAMGNDIGDINNDGWLDIINLDMVAADNYGIKTSMSAMNPAQFDALVAAGEHHQYMFNSLLLNNGCPTPESEPLFSNIGQLAGISNTDWSWGPLLFDMDNDGWQDLFISNGIKRNIRNNDATKAVEQLRQQMNATTDEKEKIRLMQQMLQQFPYHRQPNYFFKNSQQLGFTNINAEIGIDSLPTASNGAAYADFDLDGDLDLIINNVDQPATLLKNNAATKENYSLNIQLLGSPKNRFGIGAKIDIQYLDNTQTREVYTTRGYQSAVTERVHFGLGNTKKVDRLTIRWADGKTQALKQVQAGKLVLKYADATDDSTPVTTNTPLFKKSKMPFTYTHQENDFDDFKRESLLPHKMSNLGPAAATADVNNDGLMDVFIGSAKEQSAVLYIQQTDGTFTSTNEQIWQKDSPLEEVKALFIDVDRDADLDLIVGSGSNEWAEQDAAYQLRFYENMGQGKFRKNTTVLPDLRVSVGAIKAADFDQDGDLDLFIGGRQRAGQYPLPSNSFLLKNERSTFVDVTQQYAPFLNDFGMVTDALWADVDGDQRVDLVTVGEWMSPNILINQGDHFENTTETAQLATEKGWWYSIAAADFDGDGDLDLVGGNLGLNYKYQATDDAPFAIHTTDFDQNGSQDIVLSYQTEGTAFPLRGRECSSNQMPFIKKKFPTYAAFGKATMQEVYDEEKLATATHYQANNFAHCYFENQGDGSFRTQPLPVAAQISSINTMLIDDFDGDGQLDILAAGNLYGSEVETPRNDASFGQLLQGNGKGKFTVVPNVKSGLQVKGEVRQILRLPLSKGSAESLIFVVNDGRPEVYKNR